jgi:transcriptional regulator with XRE-family HTH domain
MTDSRPPYTRGKPRTAAIEIGGQTCVGYDVDDVLRDILLDVKDANGWSQKEFGDRLGLPQAAVSRYLNGKPHDNGGPQEFPVSSLTRLCLMLDQDPIQVFAQHPLYEEGARKFIRYPKDHLYEKYNAVLRTAEVPALLDALSQARELGIFADCLAMLSAHITSTRDAIQRAERSAHAKPSPSKRTARRK